MSEVIPPLWTLFNPPYRCPKCGSTSFRLITHISIYDTLYFDEDGHPTIELEDLSDIAELNPLYCDEIECAECDEPIEKSELFRHIDREDVEYSF